jgi:hypothetical protein
VSTEELALLDEYFRGQRHVQDIIDHLGGKHTELPEPDPELAMEEFITWYSGQHGDIPDGDAVEGLAEEWLGMMVRGSQHLVSPRRVTAFRDAITEMWMDEEEVRGVLALLPEWIRWNGDQAGMAPQLIDDAVSAARG